MAGIKYDILTFSCSSLRKQGLVCLVLSCSVIEIKVEKKEFNISTMCQFTGIEFSVQGHYYTVLLYCILRFDNVSIGSSSSDTESTKYVERIRQPIRYQYNYKTNFIQCDTVIWHLTIFYK